MKDTPFVYVTMCSLTHYSDVIMTTMASQITSLTVVYSTVYSDADQIKHQSSASLAFVRGFHRAQRASYAEMFPFDDVIMKWIVTVALILTFMLSRNGTCYQDLTRSSIIQVFNSLLPGDVYITVSRLDIHWIMKWLIVNSATGSYMN